MRSPNSGGEQGLDTDLRPLFLLSIGNFKRIIEELASDANRIRQHYRCKEFNMDSGIQPALTCLELTRVPPLRGGPTWQGYSDVLMLTEQKL